MKKQLIALFSAFILTLSSVSFSFEKELASTDNLLDTYQEQNNSRTIQYIPIETGLRILVSNIPFSDIIDFTWNDESIGNVISESIDNGNVVLNETEDSFSLDVDLNDDASFLDNKPVFGMVLSSGRVISTEVIIGGKYSILSNATKRCPQCYVAVVVYEGAAYTFAWIGRRWILRSVVTLAAAGAKTISALLRTARYVSRNGRMRNYEKRGNFSTAKKDFNSLNPRNVRTYSNGTTTGYVEGKVVTIYPKSTSTRGPTMKIKYSRSNIKAIRYR